MNRTTQAHIDAAILHLNDVAEPDFVDKPYVYYAVGGYHNLHRITKGEGHRHILGSFRTRRELLAQIEAFTRGIQEASR